MNPADFDTQVEQGSACSAAVDGVPFLVVPIGEAFLWEAEATRAMASGALTPVTEQSAPAGAEGRSINPIFG